MINQKGLFEVKKHRRRKLNDNKSTSVQIGNSSSVLDYHIVHRSNCRFYQPPEALGLPTSPSLNPYLIDAPAASPEVSDVMDSTTTPGPAIELRIISPSSVVNSSVTPLKATNHLGKCIDVTEMICSDVNATPSANNIVEHLLVETMDKKSDIQFCECYHHDDISEDDNDDDTHEEKPKKKRSKIGLFLDRYCLSYFTKFRQLISSFVASKYFRRIVLSAIVINTLSMGIEYHGQPQSLTNALEYSNLVFTSLFAIEMILKIIAEGFLKYIKNAYNLFDGIIVIMSVIELQGNQNSGLSVLRTFRLLRVLKLVRFMPTLRRQLVRIVFIH
jgi:hypothetical protein